MSKIMIKIATDYSLFPAGRYRIDGPFSGEKFRDEVLFPAVSSNDKVIVDLDDTLGLGSSFLEEAFGGLIRNYGLDSRTLRNKLEIKSSLSSYVTEIWEYIDQAKKRR